MTKHHLLTQSRTKRDAAEALRAVKSRNDWTNSDMGEALGCGEGTVRNRLDDEDASHQMTLHEMRRLVAVDGPTFLNAMVGDLGYVVRAKDECARHADAMAVASAKARCAADLISALSDGEISRDEALRLLPQFEALTGDLVHLKGQLRTIIRGPQPQS